ARAENDRDDRWFGEEPCERHLRRRSSDFARDANQSIDDGPVSFVVERAITLAKLSGVVTRARGNGLAPAIFPRKKAARERGPRENAEPEFLAERGMFAFEIAARKAVLRLQRHVRREVPAVGDPKRFHHSIRRIVRHPRVDDLSSARRIVERAQKLFLSRAN